LAKLNLDLKKKLTLFARGKSQLGIGLFIHELAQGAFDLLHFSDTHNMIINWMKVENFFQ